MYFIYDSQNSICQLGLGRISQATPRAGLFALSSNSVASQKKQPVWIWESSSEGTESEMVEHTAHLRFSIQKYESKIQGLNSAIQKFSNSRLSAFMKATIQKLVDLPPQKAMRLKIAVRGFFSVVVLWNFLALGSGFPKTSDNNSPPPEPIAYKIDAFLKAVGETKLAEKISREKRVFSSGEIPKLQGMVQYRFLPLSGSVSAAKENSEVVLFAPVKSFLSFERESGKVERERAHLMCDGVGVFFIHQKDLLLVAEKELVNAKAIPHYALYALDAQTAQTFAAAKSCAEVPVNLKEAFSFL